MSKKQDLKILQWVGIVLACLTTLFTLVIVGSHISGRLVGMSKLAIVGSIGAEFICVVCAFLAGSTNKRLAVAAVISQVILTAVLLFNASVALDLDWQEQIADRSQQRALEVKKAMLEEERKTLAEQAKLAEGLAQSDKRLAREFVKQRTAKPVASTTEAEGETDASAPKHVDVGKLGSYERFGLTIAPLLLALLAVVGLLFAAHTGAEGRSHTAEPSWGGWHSAPSAARYDDRHHSTVPDDEDEPYERDYGSHRRPNA